MNSKKSGFTLIEVLVGLGIVSVSFLAGYAGYQDFARRQILETSREELKSNLVYARHKALSGDSASACNALSDTLEGFSVTFAASSYTISPKCTGGANPGASYSKQVNLPTNVTLAISGFVSPLVYKTVSGTNLSSNGTLTLTFGPTGATQIVTVTAQGVVQ